MNYIFRYVLLSAAVVSFMLGHFLFAIKMQRKISFKPYKTSRLLIACSYMVMALDLFIGFANYDDSWVWPRAIFYNYILYYIICVLFSYGFCNLLDRNYITCRRIYSDAFLFILLSGFAITSWIVREENAKEMLSLAANLFLVCYIVRFVLHFRKLYLHCAKILTDYYSEDMYRIIRWINKCIFLLVIFAFLSVVVMFMGIEVNILFQLYAIVLNLYVATTFINFSSKLAELEEVCHDWDMLRKTDMKEEKVKENEEQSKKMGGKSASEEEDALLESKLKVWVAAKKYLSIQFTIDAVAHEIGVNRNYLSRYINEHYHMNFSEWIAQRRIVEAQRLMKEMPEAKLEEIAFRSGFSSASYFSKVFSRIVGMSPMRWRENLALHSEGVKP